MQDKSTGGQYAIEVAGATEASVGGHSSTNMLNLAGSPAAPSGSRAYVARCHVPTDQPTQKCKRRQAHSDCFWNFDCSEPSPENRDTIIRQWGDDGRRKKTLRYVAETEPEQLLQQLPLEQGPMYRTPYNENRAK